MQKITIYNELNKNWATLEISFRHETTMSEMCANDLSVFLQHTINAN